MNQKHVIAASWIGLTFLNSATATLIGRWSFEEGVVGQAVTNVPDLSGQGHSLTNLGIGSAVLYVTTPGGDPRPGIVSNRFIGMPGSVGARFAGFNQDHLRTTPGYTLGNCTLEAWVDWRGVNTDVAHGGHIARHYRGGTSQWLLNTKGATTANPKDMLSIFTGYDPPTTTTYQYPATALASNRWVHVAVRRKAVGNTSYWDFYFNGVPMLTNIIHRVYGPTEVGYFGLGEAFDGTIAEMALSDAILEPKNFVLILPANGTVITIR